MVKSRTLDLLWTAASGRLPLLLRYVTNSKTDSTMQYTRTRDLWMGVADNDMVLFASETDSIVYARMSVE